MTPAEAVFLGLVQGLTEFFPVSSSGHLVLAERLVGVNPPGVAFEVLVHVATLAAVLVVYRRRVVSLAVGGVRGERPAWRYLGKLALASVPAAAVGLTAAAFVSRLFDVPVVTAWNLMVTGLVVYSTRWLVGLGREREPGWGGSLAIGIAQAVAILPGISRSGATVAVALGARTEREAAAEFSFLLSIPAILGASLVELPAMRNPALSADALDIVMASATAFVSGVLAILIFIRWLRVGRFHHFAYYCWTVGGLYLVYAFVTG